MVLLSPVIVGIGVLLSTVEVVCEPLIGRTGTVKMQSHNIIKVLITIILLLQG